LNGDGIRDIAVSSSLSDQVWVLLGQGSGGVPDGTFVPQAGYSVASYPLGLASADLNGDGYTDVVAACYYGNGASLLLGGCSSTPGTPHLASVRDVPNDQGGHVFVRWTASSFDVAGSATPISGYRVWRRLPPGSAMRPG